ncbi:MAG: EAL domain-containing protein [Vulcanimicrobiaceae bacterium]
MRPSAQRFQILRFAAVIVAGYVVAWVLLFGASTHFANVSGIYAWYPSVGISIYLLLRFGLGFAPALVLAELVGNFVFGRPAHMSWPVLVGFSALKAAGYTGFVAILTRVLKVDRRLETSRDLALFFLVMGIVAPYVVGLYATLLLMDNHYLPPGMFRLQTLRFWIGDSTGIVTVVPLITYVIEPLIIEPQLLFARFPLLRTASARKVATQYLILLAVTATSLRLYFASGANQAVLYSVLVPLAWIVLSRGLFAAGFACFVVDLFMIVSLRFYHAPMEVLIDFQIFMLTASLISFALASAVTEREWLRLRLGDTLWQLERTQETAAIMIAQFSADGTWMHVPRRLARLFHMSPSQLSARRLDSFCDDDSHDALQLAIDRVARRETDSSACVIAVSDGDGRRMWLKVDLSPVHHVEHYLPALVGYIQDVTAQKHLEEQLAYFAYHDRLTGLPNRLMFEQSLRELIGHARRSEAGVAVLYLDLDGFKEINDALGHAAGDMALCEIASRLEHAVRSTDIVARFGGDEFVVTLSDIRADVGSAARRFAQSLMNALSQPMTIEGTEFRLSASIGISLLDGADSPEQLIREADAAMYRAKQTGRGRVELSSKGGAQRAVPTIELLALLHRAIEQDEFELFFQPIVRLRDSGRPANAPSSVVGVEALLRWRHGGQILPPSEFLSTLESHALMDAVTKWTFQELQQLIVSWLAEGITIDAWVNVSTRQLWQPKFVEFLVNLLGNDLASSEHIVVEVTESSVVRNYSRMIESLNRLTRLGLHAAIDDFGVGESSLARLRTLPVNAVKIDGSFSMALDEPQGRRIAEGIVALASRLGLHSVAEWIETREQYEFFRNVGCELGQGQYFAPPMRYSDFREFLSQRV